MCHHHEIGTSFLSGKTLNIMLKSTACRNHEKHISPLFLTDFEPSATETRVPSPWEVNFLPLRADFEYFVTEQRVPPSWETHFPLSWQTLNIQYSAIKQHVPPPWDWHFLPFWEAFVQSSLEQRVPQSWEAHILPSLDIHWTLCYRAPCTITMRNTIYSFQSRHWTFCYRATCAAIMRKTFPPFLADFEHSATEQCVQPW